MNKEVLIKVLKEILANDKVVLGMHIKQTQFAAGKRSDLQDHFLSKYLGNCREVPGKFGDLPFVWSQAFIRSLFQWGHGYVKDLQRTMTGEPAGYELNSFLYWVYNVNATDFHTATGRKVYEELFRLYCDTNAEPTCDYGAVRSVCMVLNLMEDEDLGRLAEWIFAKYPEKSDDE